MDVTLECDEFLDLPPFKISEIVSKSMDFNDFMLKKKQTIDEAIKSKKIAGTLTSSKSKNELDTNIKGAESGLSSPDSKSVPDHSYHFNTGLKSTSTPIRDPKVKKSPAPIVNANRFTSNINLKQSPATTGNANIVTSPKVYVKPSPTINLFKEQKSVDESQLLVVGKKLTNAIDLASNFKSTGKCVVCFTPVNETNSIQTNVNTQSFTEFGFILKLILGLSKCELQSNLCCTSCSSRVMHTFNDWLDINVLALLKDDVKSYSQRICEDCKFSLPSLESFTDHLFSHIITGKPLKTKVVFKVKVPKDTFKGQTPANKPNSKHNGIPTEKPNNMGLNPKSKNIKKPKNANEDYVPSIKGLTNLGNKNKVTTSSNRTNTVLSPNIIRPTKPLRYITPKVDNDVIVIGEKQYTIGKILKNIPEHSRKNASQIMIQDAKFNTILNLGQPKPIRPKMLLPLKKNYVRVEPRANKKLNLNSGFIKLSKGALQNSNIVIDVEDDSIPDQNSVKASKEVLGLNSGDASKSVIENESIKIPNRDTIGEQIPELNSGDVSKPDNAMESEDGDTPKPDNVTIGEEIPRLNSGDVSKLDNAMESEDGDTPKPDNVTLGEEIPRLNSGDVSKPDNAMESEDGDTPKPDNVTLGEEIGGLDSDTVLADSKEIPDQDNDNMRKEIPGLNSDMVMADGKEIPDQDNDTISEENLGLNSDIVMASGGDDIPDQENTTILNNKVISNSETASSAIVNKDEVSDNVMDIDEIPTLNSDDTEVRILNSDMVRISASNIVMENEDLPDMNIGTKNIELVEEIINDEVANKSVEDVPLPD